MAYSGQEKQRAVETFVRLGRSPMLTIRGLGYPSKRALYAWYEEATGLKPRRPARPRACRPTP